MKKASAGEQQTTADQARAMAQKMARMEAALRQMNDQKNQDDTETATLKKKISCF